MSFGLKSEAMVEIVDLETRREELKQEIAVLTERKGALDLLLKDEEKLLLRVENLKQEEAEAKESLERLNEDKRALLKEVMKSEAIVSDSERLVKECEEDLDRVNKELRAAHNELREVEAEKKSKLSEINQLEKREITAKQALEILARDIEAQEGELETTGKAVTASKANLASLKQAHEGELGAFVRREAELRGLALEHEKAIEASKALVEENGLKATKILAEAENIKAQAEIEAQARLAEIAEREGEVVVREGEVSKRTALLRDKTKQLQEVKEELEKYYDRPIKHIIFSGDEVKIVKK